MYHADTLYMLLSLIKIVPSPGHEHNIIEVLDSMKGPLSALVDCLDCMIAVEWGESGTICYVEWWRKREALDRHLRSPLFHRVLEAMELSRIPPVINYYEVDRIGGFEMMEDARIAKVNTSKKN